METSVRESHVIPGSANAILISACRAHKRSDLLRCATHADGRRHDLIRIRLANRATRALRLTCAQHVRTLTTIAKNGSATPYGLCQCRALHPHHPVMREGLREGTTVHLAPYGEGDLLIVVETPSEREGRTSPSRSPAGTCRSRCARKSRVSDARLSGPVLCPRRSDERNQHPLSPYPPNDFRRLCRAHGPNTLAQLRMCSMNTRLPAKPRLGSIVADTAIV